MYDHTNAQLQFKDCHVHQSVFQLILYIYYVCSEGVDINGSLHKMVLIEHQTRDPGAEFKAAGKHWTDKVCLCTALTGTVHRAYHSLLYSVYCVYGLCNRMVRK